MASFERLGRQHWIPLVSAQIVYKGIKNGTAAAAALCARVSPSQLET